MEKLLSLREVAKALSADLSIVLRLIQSGHLCALEIGPREWRVAASDLRRFINLRRRDFAETTAATLDVR